MVGLVVGLLLVAGLALMFANASRSSGELERSVRHIESAVRHGNLESARDALKTLGPRHPHRARLEQLIAAGRERDDEFDPWGAQ